MTTRERLEVAIAALQQIKASDPGPAYWIAKGALEEIMEEDADDE